ncbi:hypothetical protein MMU43_19935, partial [Escherichia coli]|nr:hypothetical protein [Escherichia coli]MCH6328329.1 hypothetical protein [Escherichia coli]
ILLRQKQKKLIMLPSETMIWQPEFTDKTLSRKPGAVQSTHLSDLGVEFYVVEQLLGHALPGVAGVYNRSKFMAKKLDALELWTTYLNSIAGADSKVTILKQKAG